MIGQIENVAHMDLNGDGRVGGGGGHYPQGTQGNQYGGGMPPNYGGPQYGQYGAPGYPPNYGGQPGPQYGQYGAPGYPPGPQGYGQYGPQGGYGTAPPHGGGGGGGGLMGQLEKATGMDFNGDGRVGGSGGGHHQGFH